MTQGDPRSEQLVRGTFALNALLCAGAWIVWGLTDSKLVLAQASDSLLDIAGGAILVVTARVASEPRDDEHPFGHHRAEPIGALVTAILAGVLGFEILRTAAGSLLRGERADLDVWVAVILGAKLALKVGLLLYLATSAAKSVGPAVQAVRVDTRNDVLACGSSLFGYALVRWGFGWADAALAIPIAFMIAYNGVALARENLHFLMGAAPDDAVLEELRASAAELPGVLSITSLRAQWLGSMLHVEVAVMIGDWNSATEGHDLAVAVQRRLEEHALVTEAFVHVDTASGVDHA